MNYSWKISLINPVHGSPLGTWNGYYAVGNSIGVVSSKEKMSSQLNNDKKTLNIQDRFGFIWMIPKSNIAGVQLMGCET